MIISGFNQLNFTGSVDIITESVPPGQIEFTTPGTYTWIAPRNVGNVSVVCVGGGGGGLAKDHGTGGGVSGGSGGGLGWKNNIRILPGQSYTVKVGAGGNIASTRDPSVNNDRSAENGGESYFLSNTVVAGFGGQGGQRIVDKSGGGYVGDGGGNGGAGLTGYTPGGYQMAGGGGGAGGYSGNGGDGGANPYFLAQPGSGGGGGGGGEARYNYHGGGGGGVGLYGEGPSGAGGTPGTVNSGGQGGGGSYGANGGGNYYGTPNPNMHYGGLYGGGGGSSDDFNTTLATVATGKGGNGAVRIIWGGTGLVRNYPSTNTANL